MQIKVWMFFSFRKYLLRRTKDHGQQALREVPPLTNELDATLFGKVQKGCSHDFKFAETSSKLYNIL